MRIAVDETHDRRLRMACVLIFHPYFSTATVTGCHWKTVGGRTEEVARCISHEGEQVDATYTNGQCISNECEQTVRMRTTPSTYRYSVTSKRSLPLGSGPPPDSEST